MPPTKTLDNLTILVTRPRPQGEMLCEKIREAKGNAVYLPTIEIHSLNIKVPPLDQYQWLIFTSPVAVECFLKHSIKCVPKIAAIGESTAEALEKAQFKVDAYPLDQWNSEAFLKLPQFQTAAGQKIGIIKGTGGRDLLKTELVKRGALVSEWDLYERKLPKTNIEPVLQMLTAKQIDVIVCTSVDSLVNLQLLLKTHWHDIIKIPMLVVSQRIEREAEKLGIEKIFVANNASNEMICKALATIKKGMNMDTPPEKTPTAKPFPWKTIGILFSSLGIILLVALFYISHIYYLKMFSKEVLAEERFSQLQNEIKTLDSQTHQLTKQLDSQTQIIHSLQQMQTDFNRSEWRILEAEFMVKLAQNKLQYDGNIDEAIQLLKNSDAEIRDVNDPSLSPVRKALADDMANLQGATKLDVQGIYLKLSALNDQLAKLPFINKPNETPVNDAQDTQNLSWWKKGLIDSWNNLKKIVVIRYHQSGKPPLVLPQEQEFLILNLHSAVEKSMWGLLHHTPAVYQSGLQQTNQWIRDYFVVDAPIAKSILLTVQQLQAINVNPALPNVTASLQAFQNYFASLHKRNA